jgi:nitrogen fixation protein NifB
MKDMYPFQHHPCWSENRTDVWERIHLPVAAVCNVKCAFCDHSTSVSCHIQRPGSATRIMSAENAIEIAIRELNARANLRIVAVAGPGEPLANAATFEVLGALKSARPRVYACLSTNGVLLHDKVDRLVELGVDSLSVSMSASAETTAAAIYEWADIRGRRMTGIDMGKNLITAQLAGIERASDAGIHVKINSVLIPGVNDAEMALLAEKAAHGGAELQNIVPLVPCAAMSEYRPPSCVELEQARAQAREYVKQFHSCHQCRADVVGIPGADTILQNA